MIVLLVLVLGLGAGGAIGFLSCFVMLLQKYNGANRVLERAQEARAKAIDAADAAVRQAKAEIAETEEKFEKLQSSKLTEAMLAGLIEPPKALPANNSRTCGCGHHQAFHEYEDYDEEYGECNFDLWHDKPGSAVKKCRCVKFVEA